MATFVKIVLDTRKNSKKENGTYPIILRLWHQGSNRTICSLGYYATKEDWDSSAQSLLKSYSLVTNITRTNNFLTKKRTIAFDVINDFKDNNEIDELTINELNGVIRNTLNGNNPKSKIQQSKEKKPLDWQICKTFYLNYLSNIDVPKHKQRIRSKGYVKDRTLYMNRFEEFFSMSNKTVRKIKVTQISDEIVGQYYEYLESTTSSNASFNHHLRAIRNFFNYLIDEREYIIKNPYKKVALKYEGTNPQTISRIEFEQLLEVIKEENGLAVYKNGIRKNMYRPYLRFAYQLALYTGRRTEELVSFKWSNIKCNNDNEPLYIEFVDLKADRQSNFNQSKAIKMVYIPVITQLKELLCEMGYEKNIGQDKYLIETTENVSRKTIMFQLSKSFTFYYRQLNTGKNISLKHLRKTYLTHLQILTGNAISISGHSNEQILDEHYLDGIEIAKNVALSNIKILG